MAPNGFLQKLWRVQRRLVEDARPCLAGTGLDPKRAFLLAQVERGLRPGEIADRLHLPPPSVSHLLADLEAAGWLVREPDPEDRRRQRLRLTEAGRARLEAARRCLEAASNALLKALSEEERATLFALLDRLEEEP